MSWPCRWIVAGVLFSLMLTSFGASAALAADQAIDATPDPLVFASGVRVRGVLDWAARRAEMRALLLKHEYGEVPPSPASIHVAVLDSAPLFDGTARMEHFALSWAEAARFRMECGLITPATPGPHPVIVAIDPVWQPHVRATARQVIARGYAFAGLKYHDVDADNGRRDVGIYPYYPQCQWRSIAAWAWAASRLADYLVTRPEIDRAHMVITGHSRCGKAAILAGALDDRFALVAPHCSGTGGAALYRVQNAGCETLDAITRPDRFHYWFAPDLRKYAGQENTLLFDQHFLQALIAPRAFLSIEACDDRWANPRGAWAACAAALPVYKMHQAQERLAFAIHPGGHDPTSSDWATLLDFADTVFRGAAQRNPNILRGEDVLKEPAGLPAAQPTGNTRLSVQGTRFAINDRPTFLLGISYYAALGAPEENMRQDLAEMQRRGFNWVRVWATWGPREDSVSAVDPEGNAREPFWGKLQRLVAECDRRGMVVDVTLTRGGASGLKSLAAHRRAIETIVPALKAHANWYLDLANERNICDQRHVGFSELAQLRELVRRLDPKRLVTASHGGDISRDELEKYLRIAQVDFVTPHRQRDAQSASQTAQETRKLLGWMKVLGRAAPVHYQEPFRRGYSEGWEPTAADFARDLQEAIAAGAAGWCFHNGDQRGRPGRQPQRSFDLRHRRLFEQLDDQEMAFLNGQCPAVLKRLHDPPVLPGKHWAVRLAGEVGMNIVDLDRLRNLMGGRGCVIRHGYLVYAWGDAGRRADVASACKPMFVHFLFKAVEEGKLPGVDAPVIRWAPRLEGLNAGLGFKDRKITWRDFACQTSCYGVREAPSEAFDYSDFNMALFFDTLFGKVFNVSYDRVDAEVLHPRLTDLLECEDQPTLMAFGTGRNPGRLAMSVRDFARFGLLYLREGQWNGRAIIDRRYARQAVMSPVALAVPRTRGESAEMLPHQRSLGGGNNQDDHCGAYSFAWWVNGIGRDGRRYWPHTPPETFAALGHSGRRGMAVIPGLDLVLSWNDSRLRTPEQEDHAFQILTDAVGKK
jgi:dienelactone hydrolase